MFRRITLTAGILGAASLLASAIAGGSSLPVSPVNAAATQQSQDSEQHAQHHDKSKTPPDQDAGGTACCRKMMEGMHGGDVQDQKNKEPICLTATDPTMIKHHFTMVTENKELRAALVKLLKEDASLREAFESVLEETGDYPPARESLCCPKLASVVIAARSPPTWTTIVP